MLFVGKVSAGWDELVYAGYIGGSIWDSAMASPWMA